MRKIAALVCAIGLVAAACGGGDSASCDAIADDAIVLIQDLIDEFDALSLEELSGDEPAFIADFESDAEGLDQRAVDAGCSDSEMESLMDDRIDRLTSTGLIGETVIQQLQSEGFGSFTE